MVKLAFGDQPPTYDPNADNSNITRKEEIEKWAKDMYDFAAKKYGEDNITEFDVHIDETTPHTYCIVIPINQSGKLSFRDVFVGKDNYEFSKRTKSLWEEAEMIAKNSDLNEVMSNWPQKQNTCLTSSECVNKFPKSKIPY